MAPSDERALAGNRPQARDCTIDPCGFCSARSVSVCRAVPHASLGRLAEAVTIVTLQKGQLLVRQGDPSAFMFNVTGGALKLYKLLPDGRRQIVGFLFSGDFLGVGRRATYGFTAKALVPSQLCRFSSRSFLQLMDEFPPLERELLCRASSELSAAQDQMLLLGRKSARERLASFLYGLHARAKGRGHFSDTVWTPMTRTDIADYLGLTTETVSRVFTEFRRQGRIQVPRAGEVQLKDTAALKSLAEGNG